MIYYRLRAKTITQPDPDGDWWRNRSFDALNYFKTVKMSENTALFYVTREAVDRAMSQISRPERYEIVAFEVTEVPIPS